MSLEKALKFKLSGKGVRDIIMLITKNLARDVEPVILRGLDNVENVILAKAFTKYAWLLVIYGAIGKQEGNTLIIYYNSEDPKWTASIVIHELAHVGLGIKRRNTEDVIIDETLAYIASFKSGFISLYEKGIRQAVKLLSECANRYGELEIAHIIIPRILAYRLIAYNYDQLVHHASDLEELLQLWLETKPDTNEKRALATALKLAEIGCAMNSQYRYAGA